MSDAYTAAPADAIAVIGMAARLPGAGNVDELWANLTAGVESIRAFSDEELAAAGVAESALRDPRYVKAGAVLDDVECFDAAFFGIHPGIAQITDPQHRVFLELAWQALEHAGHDPARAPGDIGVFAGLSLNTYLIENLATHRALFESYGQLQAGMANRGDHLATLAAYKLDLRGPAMAVQSTCSTGLTAVHVASQALLGYQCDLALAGGVAIRVPQIAGYLFQDGGIASPDGHCRPFDARARGTVFGSGAGVVVLRRLDDALAAGDTVHAVIRGSAATNDGAAKIGYTAPSSDGQRRTIAMAHAVAGVHPDTIEYVECHGTGTELGDPIEIEALSRAFAAKTQRTGFCAIGSVKSNIGHLDTAAGIAGFIKAVLCLRHRARPPTLHFQAPNPQLDLPRTPFYVNRELEPWPARREHPRRAGVSAFGIGGTNIHVVLEEAPAAAPPRAQAAEAAPQLVILSARSARALEQRTEQLRSFLAAPAAAGDPEIADVAYTLQLGRAQLSHRRIMACHSRAHAVELLTELPPERVFTAVADDHDRPVAFVFAGVGGGRPVPAAELADRVPPVRAHLAAVVAALAAHAPAEVAAVRSALADPSADAWGTTASAEPAMFAFEYALARTWMDWGIEPRAVVGTGVGELTAACIAGAVSLDDAAAILAARSRALRAAPAGAGLVVLTGEGDLRAELADRPLAVVAIGRPSLCVVAGAVEAIEALHGALGALGISARRLRGDRALGAPVLRDAARALANELGAVSLAPPRIPWLSGTSGTWLGVTEARYFADALAAPARLDRALAELFVEPARVVLEIGPGRTMTNLARLHPAKRPDQVALTSVELPDQVVLGSSDPPDAALAMTLALGRLWLHGARVDWAAVHAGRPRRRVPLPQYPFERRRLWLDPPAPATADAAALPSRAADLAEWFYVPAWRRAALPVGPQPPPGRTVVIGDDLDLGAAIADALARAGHRVTRVVAGARYERLAEDRYALALDQAADYRELWAELDQRGDRPTRIVHLASLAPLRATATDRLAAADQAQRHGVLSVIALAQAIGPQRAPVLIDVVTSGVAEVSGDEPLAPDKATLIGPCLVIGQEYADLRCRFIDVELQAPGGDRELRMIRQLCAELCAGDATPPGGSQIAWRGGHRWVRYHERVRIPEGAPGVIRAGATYLITGGLGGIGLELAAALARSAPELHLVLIGRTALPPRPAWDDVIAGGDPRVAAVLRKLRALEATGARVTALAADVSDRAQLAAALRAVREGGGQLAGVIHAAGVPSTGALQRGTPAQVAAVFAAKVRGALLLDELLAGHALDFMVYCSSRTTALGGLGQTDYAAANAFLDAYAHWRSRHAAGHTVAIDWCGWREVGMLAHAAERWAPEAAAPEPPSTPAAGARVIGHPLLHRRVPAPPGVLAFETELRVDTHWALDDHRILGNPVIAGTTYLEMVRAAIAAGGDAAAAIELSDVYFLAPLSVRTGETRVARLELTADPAGGYQFTVTGRGPGGAQTYVTGRARALTAPGDERRDLDAIRARCDRRTLALTDEDARNDDQGPRWQCVREVRWGDGEVIAMLELPSDLTGDLVDMKIHPGMLDKAIGTGRDFLLGEVPYMPYAYRRLVIYRPMPARIFVHNRQQRAGSSAAETPTFDLTLTDASGAVVIDIQGFSIKRVNNVGAMFRALAEQDAPLVEAGPPPAPAPPAGRRSIDEASDGSAFAQLMRLEAIAPSDGAEAFLRILASRIGPQVVVSTRDLDALRAHGGMAHVSAAAAASPARAPALPPRPLQPRPALAGAYVSPTSALEEQLAEIWRDALGVDPVGIHDNFFDLGGDSVLALQLLARLRDRMGAEIAAVQLFESPTIAALARALGPLRSPSGGDALPSPATELSEVQSRGDRRRARALGRRRPGPDSEL